MIRFREILWSSAWLCLWLALPLQVQAGSLRYCDESGDVDTAAQDRLIRVAGLVKEELEASGRTLALVSRSGLALQRFGFRYSHAGVSLKNSNNTPWSVRQLYYACQDKRPRIFDQGMAGFLLGLQDPSLGFLSIVFLPKEAADALEVSALNDKLALQLQASTYSANAYAFGLLYQNCNQWLIELMASAWGETPPEQASRETSQQWLQKNSYAASTFDIGWWPLMWLANQIQWLHNDDHPESDLQRRVYQVSMPASIENFARQRYPEATRMEICYTKTKVVIRRGWLPLSDECEAGPDDIEKPLAFNTTVASK